MNIYLDCDTLLKFSDFANMLTGAAIVDKTLSAYLYDIDDDSQLGAEVTLTDNSDGDYVGTIADTHVGLKLGQRVRIELTANGGSGLMCKKSKIATVVEAK